MTPETNQAKTAYITPGVAAKKLGMSVRTLARLANAGQLTTLRIGSGHRRFDLEEVEALRKGKAS